MSLSLSLLLLLPLLLLLSLAALPSEVVRTKSLDIASEHCVGSVPSLSQRQLWSPESGVCLLCGQISVRPCSLREYSDHS
jgi:hypothetical protein